MTDNPTRLSDVAWTLMPALRSGAPQVGARWPLLIGALSRSPQHLATVIDALQTAAAADKSETPLEWFDRLEVTCDIAMACGEMGAEITRTGRLPWA